MAHIVRSARGVRVDFDLLKIKKQMASAPKPTNVAARESFIDQKFKRKLKKIKREVQVVEPPLRAEPDIDNQQTEESQDES